MNIDHFFRKNLKHYNIPGHAHFLTFSCYQRMKLLNNEFTRQAFIKGMHKACKQWDVACWAYVIMPEHAHVLVYPRQQVYQIEKYLQTFKQSVAQRVINRLRKTNDSVLARLQVEDNRYQYWQQSAGYDQNVVEPLAIHQIIEYIHENPVRRELVVSAVDWFWSSARAWLMNLNEPFAIDRDIPTLHV
jgi:putative transposase